MNSEQSPTSGSADQYDRLLDPNDDLSDLTVDGAAVRTDPTTSETSTSTPGDLAAIQKAGAQQPLTAEDIAARRGGEMPTPDQVAGINKARDLGKHIS